MCFPEQEPPACGSRASGLDTRTDALVGLAALIALGASAASYRGAVEAALDAGASVEDIVGTLVAVAPTVGLSRMVAATTGLALALGYDIEAALERLEPSGGGSWLPPRCRR